MTALRRAVILAALLVLSSTGMARAADEIRVAIADGARAIEVSGGPMAITGPGGRALADDTPTWLRAVPAPGGIELRTQRAGRVRVFRAASVRLVSVDGQGLRFNSRVYPGTLTIAASGDRLTAINDLGFEEYLAGAVKAEAGERMPLEMLKAQAIVARTYAAYQRVLHAGKPYHITASTAHQQYSGRVAAESPVWVAVKATRGQVLLLDGGLFPAFYHTDSGGHTEDPRAVFAALNMPALKAVRVEFPSASPHHEWRLELPLAQISAQLAKAGLSVGRVVGLEVLERSASMRVSQIAVRGVSGSAVLRGNDLRRIIGYDTLKSTLFSVEVGERTAYFAGRGYGHGVGLDQSSARTMAEMGYDARQIIEYYYPGVTMGVLP